MDEKELHSAVITASYAQLLPFSCQIAHLFNKYFSLFIKTVR